MDKIRLRGEYHHPDFYPDCGNEPFTGDLFLYIIVWFFVCNL